MLSAILLSLLTSTTVAIPISDYISQGLAAGYYSSGVPAGYKQPSTAGFKDATSGPSRGGRSICISGRISVQASTTHNANLSVSMIPPNQTALTGLFVSTFRSTASPPASPVFITINETFDIGATLCGPANATSAPTTVEVLTHGVGFDRYYWDFAPGYSYVDAAVEAGHSVLYYDRLGNGVSDHPDPLTVQTPIQLEIAHSLITMLRAGQIGDNAFAKVIGVGHSFGSGITQAINVHYPDLFDASVLTGFGVNSSALTSIGFDFGGNPTIASQADPLRFANLPLGYMVPNNEIGNQIQFFSYPGFDPAILAQVEAQKGTQTIGEVFSPMIGGVASNYSKPLAVVNGAEDWPYCQGNCSYPTNQALGVQAIYPSVTSANFGTFLAENAGHGLNLHYSANTAYAYIQDFLKRSL